MARVSRIGGSAVVVGWRNGGSAVVVGWPNGVSAVVVGWPNGVSAVVVGWPNGGCGLVQRWFCGGFGSVCYGGPTVAIRWQKEFLIIFIPCKIMTSIYQKFLKIN